MKPLESKDVQVTSRDAVIVVAPGVTQSWTIGYDLARSAGAPVVFLNSQLSERYSLGGPLTTSRRSTTSSPSPRALFTGPTPAAGASLRGNQPVCRVHNSSRSHFTAMTQPCWLRRVVRNRHRHAIEQVSRRWRGGRRDDAARTRRAWDFHARCILDKPDGTQANSRVRQRRAADARRAVPTDAYVGPACFSGAAMNYKFTNDPRFGGGCSLT